MIDDASRIEADFHLLVEQLTAQIELCADEPQNRFHLETLQAARAKAVQGVKLVHDYHTRHPNTVKSDT